MKFFVVGSGGNDTKVIASTQGQYDTEASPDELTSWTVNHKWRRLIAGYLLGLADTSIYDGTEPDLLDTTSEADRLINALYGQVDTMALGTIWWFADDNPLPDGWLLADGSVYDIADYPELGALYLDKYAGDGITTFGVPDLLERFARGADTGIGTVGGQDTITLTTAQLPAHVHDYGYPSVGVDVEAPGVPDFTAVGNPPTTLQTSSVGNGDPIETVPLHMRLRPAVKAVTTGVVIVASQAVSGFVVGEIRWLAIDPQTIPSGWAYCNGGAFNKNTYPELFAAIGYTYGGSGDFPLIPDMVHKSAVGADEVSPWPIGTVGGAENHTLTIAEIPAHTHNWYHQASGTATANTPTVGTVQRNVQATSSAGDDQPHNNMPPYIALTPVIRLIP